MMKNAFVKMMKRMEDPATAKPEVVKMMGLFARDFLAN